MSATRTSCCASSADQTQTDFLKARSLAIQATKAALEGAGFALPEPIYPVGRRRIRPRQERPHLQARRGTFRHLIVMDCGDWGDTEDERRLLYVAMTRAKETLTVFRADASPNPFVADLDAVESVFALAPQAPPSVRPELRTRYRTLTPADVVISFAGWHSSDHRVHVDNRAPAPGRCGADPRWRTGGGGRLRRRQVVEERRSGGRQLRRGS